MKSRMLLVGFDSAGIWHYSSRCTVIGQLVFTNTVPRPPMLDGWAVNAICHHCHEGLEG